MFKKIVLSLLLVLAGIAGYAWMRPDTYTVQREIRIDAPPRAVYALIADFRQWPHWSPWERVDPNMQRLFEGTPATVGSAYSWKGDDAVGSGRMTIVSATPARRLDIALEFIEPMASSNRTEFVIEPVGPGTRVQWRMTGASPYVLKLMSLFVSLDAAIGKDFEQGLSRLKQHAENVHSNAVRHATAAPPAGPT